MRAQARASVLLALCIGRTSVQSRIFYLFFSRHASAIGMAISIGKAERAALFFLSSSIRCRRGVFLRGMPRFVSRYCRHITSQIVRASDAIAIVAATITLRV